MADYLTIFTDVLEDQGYRLTGARRAILEALIASAGHVSADELVELVHRGSPGIGRMTVYRTLEMLTELGLIRPVYQGSAAARYVLMAEGHHHHLICSSCNRIVEFDQCALQDIAQIISGRHDFVIQGHLLEIYGLCQECRQ